MEIRRYTIQENLISVAVACAISTALLVMTVLNEKPEKIILPKIEKISVVEKSEIIVDDAENQVITKEPELISLGEFKLTAYCSCAECCGEWANNRPKDKNGDEIVYGASGSRLRNNYSVAVDPEVISYGSVIIIDGQEYEAMDCGGGIKGNRIDVYFGSHEEALKFAVRTADVYMKAEIEE